MNIYDIIDIYIYRACASYHTYTHALHAYIHTERHVICIYIFIYGYMYRYIDRDIS